MKKTEPDLELKLKLKFELKLEPPTHYSAKYAIYPYIDCKFMRVSHR